MRRTWPQARGPTRGEPDSEGTMSGSAYDGRAAPCAAAQDVLRTCHVRGVSGYLVSVRLGTREFGDIFTEQGHWGIVVWTVYEMASACPGGKQIPGLPPPAVGSFEMTTCPPCAWPKISVVSLIRYGLEDLILSSLSFQLMWTSKGQFGESGPTGVR